MMCSLIDSPYRAFNTVVRQVASAQLGHQNKDPHTQSSEPILFFKLRIYFADFPYPHCSID